MKAWKPQAIEQFPFSVLSEPLGLLGLNCFFVQVVPQGLLSITLITATLPPALKANSDKAFHSSHLGFGTLRENLLASAAFAAAELLLF